MLEQLLDFELDKKLNQITQDSNLQTVVYKLIKKAQAEGWLIKLVQAARKENSGNSELAAIARELLSRETYTVTDKKPNIPGSDKEPDNQDKIKKVSYFSRVTIVFGIVVLTSIGWTYYNYTSSVCMKYKVPNGIYFYAGSTTWALFREKVERSIQNDCPNFTLKFMQHPPGTNASTFGIKKLLQSQVDFSISSRNLQPEEEKSKLKQIPVAIDATAIVFNYDLNLPKSGLTIDKLRSIYTGIIPKWNQLGVPENLQISIYEVRNSSYSFLVKQEVLDGKDSAYKSIPVSSITEGVQKVKENKGGIYISSSAHLVSQCSVRPLPLGQQENQLVTPYQLPFIPSSECTKDHKNQPNILAFRNGKYPLINRLFVIIKPDDDRSQESGQAFANLLRSSKYQEIIKESGFVKISE
ncbi:MAG: substrate-binding domain-containing protein [Stigonema ocellatum SAG 48.90 = DSM 106950]|nr:substrate-binding domain-containing protein [Stigonema ocellatum SAG 48.90 = DSM 106950]